MEALSCPQDLSLVTKTAGASKDPTKVWLFNTESKIIHVSLADSVPVLTEYFSFLLSKKCEVTEILCSRQII